MASARGQRPVKAACLRNLHSARSSGTRLCQQTEGEKRPLLVLFSGIKTKSLSSLNHDSRHLATRSTRHRFLKDPVHE